MCVAAIAWQAHPRWRLVVAANRDELHDRPAAPLHVWPEGIIAGRDMQSGGTWLGVHPQGRCVLVTNYRVPGYPLLDRPSRGALVTALLGDADLLQVAIAAYNPFNLFHADSTIAHIITNQPDTRRAISPGIHGLSNGGFDDPWPKTLRLCGAVEDWLAGPAQDIATLFPALADATPLAASEARYSSVFIRDPRYGTRCSTVLAIGHDGRGTIIERSFDGAAQSTGEVAIDFP
ncbi:MAG: NRDE family protein [Pseudomonadota bacterium]|nr:NRDE family protein [Pseudomonadota bacterium]